VRQVGGSAWKFARRWAEEESQSAVFVTRVASEATRPEDTKWQRWAFLNDARWLRQRIRDEAGGHDRLKYRLETAQEGKPTDYCFRLFHDYGEDAPSSIFSLGCGAASDLVWGDIEKAWVADRDLVEQSEKVLIFLSGPLRTNLLSTLWRAHQRWRKARKPKDVDEQLFGESGPHIAIDLGRTDLRMSLEYAVNGMIRAENGKRKKEEEEQMDEEEQRERRSRCKSQLPKGRPELDRKTLADCLRHVAHTVLVDRATADDLDLLNPQKFNPGGLDSRQIIVRPYGIRGDDSWWQFTERESGDGEHGRDERLRCRWFAAPMKEKWPGRPASTALLMRELLEGSSLEYEEGYVEPRHFRSVEDITTHKKFKEELKAIEDLVKTDDSLKTLLLYGETGTGKEIVARWLHRARTGGDENFVAVSCGRLDGQIVDSELFGHKVGAFTGAWRDREGKFVAAHEGTLLIDDLDAMPWSTQAKLLRVIEDGEVIPVGADAQPHPVNVFTIVTTNKDPRALALKDKDGLREDLYYRLIAGGVLEIPPLRERREDAVRAAERVWEECNMTWGRKLGLPKSLEDFLSCDAELGGNYRSLEVGVKRMYQLLIRPGSDVHNKVPGDVSKILHGLRSPGSEEDGPKKGTYSGTTVRTPPLPPHLERLHQESSHIRSTKPSPAVAFEEFLELWGKHRGVGGLTRKEIQRCTEIPEKELRQLLRTSGHTRTDGRGRSARWSLV